MTDDATEPKINAMWQFDGVEYPLRRGQAIVRASSDDCSRSDLALPAWRVRSVYHLKEADPSAWVLPRLTGPAKAALAELLYDEYGGGRAERLHAGLFARGMPTPVSTRRTARTSTRRRSRCSSRTTR